MQSYWPRRATYSDSSTTTSRRAWRRPFSPICLLEVEAAAAVEDTEIAAGAADGQSTKKKKKKKKKSVKGAEKVLGAESAGKAARGNTEDGTKEKPKKKKKPVHLTKSQIASFRGK